MNDRIRELAEQAKLRPALLLKHWGTDDALTDSEQEELDNIEKFAELIVRECIRQCDGNHDYKNRIDTDFGKGVAMGITLAKAQINTHFGVEE